MTTLEVIGAGKTYSTRRGPLVALADVHLTVRPGELVSLVGPSGCGKSTLARMAGGLERPTHGRIAVGGQPVRGPGRDRGFVFQQDSLFPWRTVLDNTAFGLEAHGVPRRRAREQAREYVRLVGLTPFEGAYPYELSGGMRQRVNLARALAVEPAVLLMDEPFAALDALTRETMQAELLQLVAHRRLAVLFITHQIDEAVYLSDRVVVLTPRPGSVRASIAIDLPRPRPAAVRREAAFVAYAAWVDGLLRHDSGAPPKGEPDVRTTAAAA